MPPSNFKFGALIFGLLSVAMVSSSAAGAAADVRSDLRETEGGLLIEAGLPPEMPDRTVFGIPYRGQGRVVQIASTATPFSEVKNPGARPLIAPMTPDGGQGDRDTMVKRTPENIPLFLDYVIALRSAPIEMLVPGAVIVDGNRISVGHAFSFNLPLSRFTGAVKSSTSNRAGAPDAKRTIANDDDTTMVPCTFQVTQVEFNGVLTVKVLSDKRYPPREIFLTFNYADSRFSTDR